MFATPHMLCELPQQEKYQYFSENYTLLNFLYYTIMFMLD